MTVYDTLGQAEAEYDSRSAGTRTTNNIRAVAHDHNVGVTIQTNPSAHAHAIDVPAHTGASGAGSGHSHSVSVPAHAGPSGTGSGHTHGVDIPALTGTSGSAGAHGHAIGMDNAQHAHAASSSNVGITGAGLNAVRKQHADDLRVLIDGADVTGTVLSMLGLEKLGDNTAAHTIHSAVGSGQIDLLAILGGTPTAGHHRVEIREPVAGRGARVRGNVYVN